MPTLLPTRVIEQSQPADLKAVLAATLAFLLLIAMTLHPLLPNSVPYGAGLETGARAGLFAKPHI